MFEAGSLIYRIQTVGSGLFKAELSEAERAAKKASDTLKDTAKSTKGLGDQSRLTKPRLHEITGEIRNMSDEAQQASREVGGSMLAIGASVVAMVGLTVKASSDWESAWAGVTKTVDGTPEQLAQVEEGLRGLTKELPATHAEIAAVAEAAGQLGVKAEDITAFTKTMVDLGETTNLTSDEAATSLAQFMNVMKTAPEDVGRLGAAVVALGNDGASTERDIVQMSQRIAGAARVIGLSEGETLGLANALSSVGIEAEAGGSSVSAVMIDIAKAVSANGEDLQKWAQIAGMSADEFGSKWKDAPAEALTLVIEGMGRLNAAGGDVFATLSDVEQTDIRVTRSLLSLAGAGDLLRDSLELGNQSWEDNTALQAEAEKRYETTASKVAMARNEVVDMAIELGEHLLPAVVAVAEGVGGFADAVGSLPEPVQGAIAIGGALIGMLALAGGAALIAIPKVVAFRTAVATLSTTMPKASGAARGFAGVLAGPWGIAITAAIAGLTALQSYVDSLSTSTATMTNALLEAKTGQEILTAAQKNNAAAIETYSGDITTLNKDLELVADSNSSFWTQFSSDYQGANIGRLKSILGGVGEEFATLASTDMPAAQRAFQTLANDAGLSQKALGALIDQTPEFRDALIDQATAMGINVSSGDEAATTQQLVAIAMADTKDETKSATEAYLEAASATSQLEQDLQSLLDVLEEANGKNQDAISANLDYRDTLAEVDEAIRQAKEGIDANNDGIADYTLTLDENSQSGRDNMRMLQDLADNAWGAAESQFALDGSVDGFRKRLEESRETLIQRADDLGYTREEAEALADRILSMPSEFEFTAIADTAAATDALDGFITRYDGRQIAIGVNTYGGTTYRVAGSRVSYEAEGSVRTAADGYVQPMSHQQAQIQRGGSYVLWAEDETEGETFVPHARSKRAQAEQYMEKTAQIFGGTYIPAGATMRPMADGGLSGSRPDLGGAMADRPISLIVQHYDPATVAQLVIQALEARIGRI